MEVPPYAAQLDEDMRQMAADRERDLARRHYRRIARNTWYVLEGFALIFPTNDVFDHPDGRHLASIVLTLLFGAVIGLPLLYGLIVVIAETDWSSP